MTTTAQFVFRAVCLCFAFVSLVADLRGSAQHPPGDVRVDAVGAIQGGQLPQPLPLFPIDNWWNLDISSAPLDANSGNFINFIGASRTLHPDLGGDAGGVDTYGMPYAVVPGNQPLEQVTFGYASESDAGAPGRPPGYPIPPEAKTQPKWIEGGPRGDDQAVGGDRHMLIVDRDNRILYELFALRWNTTLGRWEAGSGAVFPLDANLRRPDGWTSADAAGLAILPGLVRYEEVYGAGEIRHAFRVTVRATNGYVYPGSHRAGSTSGALPMGARLRLKASKDLSSYPIPIRKIFQAMKTYGLIVADNGSDMFVGGTYDTRWDNDILNPAFRLLQAGDFEVVQRGWNPASVPPCNRPAISVHPRSTAISPGQQVTLSVAASGSSPLSYQWYQGLSGDPGSPRAGATAANFTTTVATNTSLWVRVYNNCGSTDSLDAALTTTSGCDSRYGDLNLDSQVNASDAVILANHLVGNIPAGSSPFTASATFADLDVSGSVNSVDAVILSNYLAANISCLPKP